MPSCWRETIFQFQLERLAASALNIAPLEICIRDTIDYTRNRMAFGQPLINNQVGGILEVNLSNLSKTQLLNIRNIAISTAEYTVASDYSSCFSDLS